MQNPKQIFLIGAVLGAIFGGAMTAMLLPKDAISSQFLTGRVTVQVLQNRRPVTGRVEVIIWDVNDRGFIPRERPTISGIASPRGGFTSRFSVVADALPAPLVAAANKWLR